MITSFLTRYLLVPVVSADTGININLVNPLKTGQTIPTLLSRLFTALVYVAAFIAPVFIVWGAFQILTSAGNSEKLASGKKTILYTVLGFLLVLAAKGIVDIVKKVLGA